VEATAGIGAEVLGPRDHDSTRARPTLTGERDVQAARQVGVVRAGRRWRVDRPCFLARVRCGPEAACRSRLHGSATCSRALERCRSGIVHPAGSVPAGPCGRSASTGLGPRGSQGMPACRTRRSDRGGGRGKLESRARPGRRARLRGAPVDRPPPRRREDLAETRAAGRALALDASLGRRAGSRVSRSREAGGARRPRSRFGSLLLVDPALSSLPSIRSGDGSPEAPPLDRVTPWHIRSDGRAEPGAATAASTTCCRRSSWSAAATAARPSSRTASALRAASTAASRSSSARPHDELGGLTRGAPARAFPRCADRCGRHSASLRRGIPDPNAGRSPRPSSRSVLPAPRPTRIVLIASPSEARR
jgi:hypothetical protein